MKLRPITYFAVGGVATLTLTDMGRHIFPGHPLDMSFAIAVIVLFCFWIAMIGSDKAAAFDLEMSEEERVRRGLSGKNRAEQEAIEQAKKDADAAEKQAIYMNACERLFGSIDAPCFSQEEASRMIANNRINVTQRYGDTETYQTNIPGWSIDIMPSSHDGYKVRIRGPEEKDNRRVLAIQGLVYQHRYSDPGCLTSAGGSYRFMRMSDHRHLLPIHEKILEAALSMTMGVKFKILSDVTETRYYDDPRESDREVQKQKKEKK